MDDDKKKRWILIAGLLVLVIILLLLFWPRKKEVPAPSAPPAAVETTPQAPSLVAPLVEREVPTPSQASAEAVARTFAERYTSFSAESHFANVEDLYPLMTASLRAKEKAKVDAAVPSGDYYGVTSKLVSLSATVFTETRAVMDASLQRVTARGSATTSSTTYETLRLTLVFENGTWLVDSAEWQTSS